MRYGTILADPPWPSLGMRGQLVKAGRHYPTMTLKEITGLPMADLAEKNAHLYCWALLPMVADAFDVVRAWGFKPSTVITWCKSGPGLGGGFRGNTEHLIVARRGDLPFSTTAKGTWYIAKRGAHSAKPEMFMDLIESMSPGPYLELFARRQRLGWDVWGNEVDSEIVL